MPSVKTSICRVSFLQLVDYNLQLVDYIDFFPPGCNSSNTISQRSMSTAICRWIHQQLLYLLNNQPAVPQECGINCSGMFTRSGNWSENFRSDCPRLRFFDFMARFRPISMGLICAMALSFLTRFLRQEWTWPIFWKLRRGFEDQMEKFCGVNTEFPFRRMGG